jgi:predicted phage terminase large subunit-like protein
VSASQNSLPPSVRMKHLWPIKDRLEDVVSASRRAISGGSIAPSLSTFVESTTQFTLEPWQIQVCERLELLEHQTGQRILMHGPPQFGKSIIISQRWPAWHLGKNPLSRVRLACYNVTHAERFSKVNLAIMQSDEYRAMFPKARVPDRCPADEWSTAARAALLDANPSFKALGLGTGFVGLGADTLIVDDPYKNRQEALSDAINVSLWGWWNDVARVRLNPDTNVVFMFHRWQDNDIAGRLLQEGGWELLRFPAIADGGDNDPTGRALGAPLSDRYPVAHLEEVKRKQGSSFYALYQGTPRAPEGDYFKRGWFGAPVGAVPAGCQYVRYWDLAGGVSTQADYTAGVLMAKDTQGYFYVVDVQHGRWAASERNATILQRAHLDRQSFGRVTTYIEQAPGLSKEPTEDLVRQLAGFPAFADKVMTDKVSRAEPFQAQAQAGNVKLLDAEWLGRYLDELCSFPTGAHDDLVDATSGAFNQLAKRRDPSPPVSHSMRTY